MGFISDAVVKRSFRSASLAFVRKTCKASITNEKNNDNLNIGHAVLLEEVN